MGGILTGNGHRFTGIGAAFVAAAIAHVSNMEPYAEVIAAVMAAASTTLPDWLEIPRYRKGRRVGTVIKHRTLTHWSLPWFGLLVWGLAVGGLIGGAMLGAAVGALYHLLGDAPNPMGVPWLWPTKRLRIGRRGLWRSGQHEFLFGMFLNVMGFAIWKIAVIIHSDSESVLTNHLNMVKCLLIKNYC